MGFVSDDDENPLDVDEVFAAFQRGVREHVRDDDVATHFDLGVAYAEMGLLPDAANEFELVLRTEPHHTRARAELALMHALMGNPRGSTPIGRA
jgi:hypothetical protein